MESTGFSHWLVVLVETFALLGLLLLVLALLILAILNIGDRTRTAA